MPPRGYFPLAMWNYTPVLKPQPNIPIDSPCDGDLVCVQFSQAYLPYLLGVMEIYRWEDRFQGTPEEQQKSVGLWMELMRIFAMGNCCCGDSSVTLVIEHRFNPITLNLEISIDGGTTWTPDPESPIVDIPLQPPAVTSGNVDNKCDAAANGKQHIEDIIAACSEQLGTAINVFDLAVAVCEAVLVIVISLLSGGTLAAAAAALAGAIWAAAHAAFDYGKTAFDSYWTTDERDKILCALYCYIGEDGSFNASQYQGFINGWKQLATPSPAFNFVYSTVKAVQRKGLNNMCSYGESADGDCNDCDCPECIHLWDFTMNAPGLGVSLEAGTWVDGQGINIDHPEGAFNDLYAHVLFIFKEPCNARYIEVTTQFGTGSGLQNFEVSTETDGNGDFVWTPGGTWDAHNGADTSGAMIFTPDADPVPRLAFRINNFDGGYQTGDAYMKTVELRNEV